MIKRLICIVLGHPFGKRIDLAQNGDVFYYKRACKRCGKITHIKEDTGIAKEMLAHIMTGKRNANWKGLREEF